MPAFDEMLAHGDAGVQPAYERLAPLMDAMPGPVMDVRRQEAEAIFRRRGITFAVYGDTSGAERLIPFDVIPRVISGQEWAVVERGCIQRVTALNRFLADIYGAQEILHAGKVPRAAIEGNALYQAVAQGLRLPGGVHAHISGVDLVRTGPDAWYVLEDNLRTPSGVSYLLENRSAMQRLFPEWMRTCAVRPVDHYPDLLLQTLIEAAPPGIDDPSIAVLTPGSLNSAYFEHVFLASRMGVRLVEGRDLFVDDDRVWLKDTRGRKRVDVIYRRIDDDFLDPEVFRKDSVLGVPGLMRAMAKGTVTLANAVGNGVADDKAIYTYVPDMIRFYLGEEPILSNVPTWRCHDAGDLAHVLANLKDLVVKEVQGSGGYGMLVGPAATKQQIADFEQRLRANPANYIAQPTLALSTCPTFTANGIAPRHVDLRPYVLSGRQVRLIPGALTRVALKEGSLVVNSSQGGGTKDTWVLA